MTLAGRYLFDFSWTGAGILGAALAPTDPAVMFSVLGQREVGGRTGTILEGESGVNDPVGIALMVGMLDFATHANSTFWVVVREFVVEMSVGLAIGVAGALVMLESFRRIHLANPALYPLRSLAAAGVIYGVAAVAHGSGFVAVFVAGILIGDASYPHREAVERFQTSLASLAEIVVFVALGLTVNKVSLGPVWGDAILIALILAFLARPLATGPLLLRAAAASGGASVRDVERPQGRGADPVGRLCPARRGWRGRPDLRHRLRRGRVLRDRPGRHDPVRGPPARGSDANRLPGRRMIVAHLDLDAFFAAVEELEAPELRTKPLIVGGDPHGRGVVATANYVARRFGIHSAMSCAEALRRCPQAVFLTPRKRLYSDYSKAVWAAVREVVPTVERTGMDEGYLDVGEVAADFGRARAVAEAVQAAVRGATSLSCSLGVSTCKVVSKIASDRRKPGGITVVPAGKEAAFLAPFPARRLPGVGPRAEERLRRAGIETIGSLAALEDDRLRGLLPGKLGPLLRDRARGIDPRRLDLTSETVSISAEETFPRDVAEVERLQEELHRLSELVAERLGGQTGRTVTTKVRYTDFSIRSRSISLPVGTDDATRIWELACACLDRALADRPGALRLVGVGVSGLEAHRQLELV